MPNKSEKTSSSTVIKWTDDEWEQIAMRLYSEKGKVPLTSDELEEIKAKDIFLAQDALPENRHRKLISISQGFEGIRKRLQAIYQKLEHMPQEDLFEAQKPQSPPAAANGLERESQQGSAHDAPESHAGAETAPAAEQPGITQAEDQEMQAGDQAPALDEAVRSGPMPEPMPAAGRPEQAGAQAAPPMHDREPGRGPGRGVKAGREAHQPSMAMKDRASTQAADFIELSRPFVAMVCEELARALVNAVTRQAGEQALSGLLQTALGKMAPAQAPGHARRRSEPSTDKPHEGDAPATAAHPAGEFGHAEAMEEEGAHHSETEVQPLFDPKLPPSANSNFKPVIGLVGTSIHDFDDLQQHYPQLRLAAVPVDTVQSAGILRHCQRIVGLRDEIPPQADDFLRRTFRNRYVRLVGGIDQVRQQLNSWLDKPGSINAGPGAKSMQRGGKGPRNGVAKKRYKHPSRPAR